MRSIKEAVPGIHVHAFSALEVWQGAATLGLSLEAYLGRLRDLGLGSLPGTAAEVIDDEVRRVICPDKVTTAQWLEVHDAAHQVGLRSNVTLMFGHADTPRAGRGICSEPGSNSVARAGSPSSCRCRSSPWRRRCTCRAARAAGDVPRVLLVHAVARLALHPEITNVQASWVKLGPDGTREALRAGVNDLGGTLMNESISRSAGALFGQELPPEAMEELIRSAGRIPRQRTTLYGDAEERFASFGAEPLAESLNPPVKDAASWPRRGSSARASSRARAPLLDPGDGAGPAGSPEGRCHGLGA